MFIFKNILLFEFYFFPYKFRSIELLFIFQSLPNLEIISIPFGRFTIVTSHLIFTWKFAEFDKDGFYPHQEITEGKL